MGHPEGEEHGTKSKKQRGAGLKGARGARGVGGLLIWDIINGICDETPGVGGCEVIKPSPPPTHEQLSLKGWNADDVVGNALFDQKRFLEVAAAYFPVRGRRDQLGRKARLNFKMASAMASP